ncbi:MULTISPECIES: ABC transporter ATP-binding protein [Moraxella]|uniref:ATP-binding cassette domain-containing protein n=1 Tax=Moraxella nasicaprae TaxID=2904122 RepID=A0ABY6F484_9GAMM|nr:MULTISPECIES: ATP-binding cassette domain-containing protein [Moraxella]MDO4894229.1 ATP-binding cassette domain-containing protein [Moraxella sp.]UXZ04911.1 ATP-binding cassette domain-containing protein [Moraxella nasicaprae]
MTHTFDKLRLDGICHSFTIASGEQKPLFDKLNLSVKTADVVAIVGASGVGKTTLFNIASGLITPQAGKVLIDGQDRTGQAGHVGYMLQKDLLLPFKSVYDNIALPLVLQGVSKTQIHAQIHRHQAEFGLDGLLSKYPQTLSGGQKQRAALLRTYLSNDHLMLLDEPFSALDYVTKTQMYDWFRRFQQSLGLTCLIITHDIDEAMYLADYIYVLSGFPATLSTPFIIPKQADFLHSQASLQLKRQILDAIAQ